MIRLTLPILICLVISGCGTRAPICDEGTVACQYQWYIHEAMLKPPYYGRSNEIVTNISIRELAILFRDTKDDPASLLAMSMLLSEYRKHYGERICSDAKFLSLVESTNGRAASKPRAHSALKVLNKLDC
jgi:hypothetical protein